jgi:hypothetical protein
MSRKRIICRIRGGIGNQLFCYSASRRLAIKNDAELVIDNITGFRYDHNYERKYSLDHFSINVRLASKGEQLKPISRIRRAILKRLSLRKEFNKRRYIEQIKNDFDLRLLNLKINGTIYLEGYWQSELYFKDIEEIVRDDLNIIPPSDIINQGIAIQIRKCNSICIHVRWFDSPQNQFLRNNIGKDYYQKAILFITERLKDYHFFVFSDYPAETSTMLSLPSGRTTFINHNQGDENAYADLWLMTLCKHFIIANSTFSWWGAWLSNNKDKIVIAPADKKNGIGAWGFEGLIPERWTLL